MVITITMEAKELDLVRKLRNRVTDVVPAEKLNDDYYLRRWLCAREWNLEKAEHCLRKHIAWAWRNEVSTILDWKPRVNYFPYGFFGYEDQGNPVFLFPVGLYDLLEVLSIHDMLPACRTGIRILQRLEYEIQLAAERSEKPGRQAILILDFQQFSFRQVNNKTSVQAAIEFLGTFVANFPEILQKILLINTPKFFPIAFALVKPFISAHGMTKIEFCGHQKDKWQPALLNRIPKEILPPYYGGTREGIDEYCSSDTSIWNDDEPLPPGFFQTGSRIWTSTANLMSENNGDWIKSEIAAGSNLSLEFQISAEAIKKRKQLIKWSIKSEDYDIAFQLIFKCEALKTDVELVEYRRVNSHLHTFEGSLACEKPGTYAVILDNSYSKRRKKVVVHNVFQTEIK